MVVDLMITTYSKVFSSLITALAVVMFCFAAPDANAQGVQKFRGEITAVDHDAKTVTIGGKKGDATVSWDASTRFKGGLSGPSDLKVGVNIRATRGSDDAPVHTFRLNEQ